MAVRVSDAEVKEIIDTSVTTTAFISAANLVVTEKLGSSGLSEDLLKEIERWLAAHLIASSKDKQVESETIGDVSATYQGKTDMGLDSTFYGQQVKLLDTTGTMANLGKRKAKVEWIGD